MRKTEHTLVNNHTTLATRRLLGSMQHPCAGYSYNHQKPDTLRVSAPCSLFWNETDCWQIVKPVTQCPGPLMLAYVTMLLYLTGNKAVSQLHSK